MQTERPKDRAYRRLLVTLALTLFCSVLILTYFAIALTKASQEFEKDTEYLRLTLPSSTDQGATASDIPGMEVFRISYDDSGQDPNVASDSQGQSGLLIITTKARNEIQF